MNVFVIALLAIGFGLFIFNVVNAFIGYGDMRAIDARYQASKAAYEAMSEIISNSAQHRVQRTGGESGGKSDGS